MGLDNPLHIAFLLILLLLVFGAKRLPEMGRSLGSGMRGFKDSLSGEHEHEHSSLVASAEQHVAPAAAPVAPAVPVAAAAPVVAPVREPVMAVVREPGTPVA
jgi:sec-independent protein translocase protein TatA